MNSPPAAVGQTIELIQMDNDPSPILPGDQGLVTAVVRLPGFNQWQIAVKWKSGRTLRLLYPEDLFKVVS